MWLLTLLACTSTVRAPPSTDTAPAVETTATATPTTTSTPGEPPITDGPPNLVLVTIDTTRADHLSVYGYARPTTPELAWYAERAVVFERSISNAPWTKPSITTIFTSLEPSNHGVELWEDQLAEGVPTLATVLQEAGWSTHAVLTHHAFRTSANRFHVGFDTFDLSIIGDDTGRDISSAEAVTDLALSTIDALPSPFFLWVHHFDPHQVYLPHEGFSFGDAAVDLYDGEIAHSDHHLGRMLRALEERGDCIVTFVGDHGEEFEEHGGTGHGVTLYEEQLHVPLMIRVPGAAPARIPYTVPHLDLAPTLLALVDVPPPPSFDGTAWPWDGGFQLTEDRPAFSETVRFDRAIVALTEGRDKIIHDARLDTWALYELDRDPTEQVNLRDEEPTRFEAMQARLATHYGLEL